ncbi:Cuticlin-6 [Frankliniella fusca]|uniref:Cuticlin-6 n=1 Tax=Frankliniella fusca TaxID=407009 RepID=A0AAE1GZJ5_9NEOP|nr:Cuticlin-6 [Frankliniella fusca]
MHRAQQRPALQVSLAAADGDMWPLERPAGMPAIQALEVMCGKDHMDVHLTFTQPFDGLVSSKGQYGDPRCVYVPPSTGKASFSFRIAYSHCGTKPDLHGQFYENTVVVQYDKDLLEVWDEAKRLRCEWYNDYEKTASKPPMVIADLDVIQLDFRGDNVDCWMEIQHGKGPWAPPVSGIVPLGSTLTLVVAINDYRGEFDMRVKSCAASDGGGHVIQLSDEHGCVLRPKMISRFLKARTADERASVVTYAFFHAFKFPDALSVHIKCKVEICRHGCLDHCQQAGLAHGAGLGQDHGLGGHDSADALLAGLGGGLGGGLGHDAGLYGPLERKDQPTAASPAASQPRPVYTQQGGPTVRTPANSAENGADLFGDLIYDELVQMNDEGGELSGGERDTPTAAAHKAPRPARPHGKPSGPDMLNDMHHDMLPRPFQEPPPRPSLKREGAPAHPQERFPHGPRHLDSDELPVSREARSAADNSSSSSSSGSSSSSSRPAPQERRRRSVAVSDRHTRSADVGVSGLYEVISEADLAFTPDSKAESVIVFQGRIREEVVYGICLPVQGFSVLFVLVAVSAVVSALVAGSLLYRYQVQRETQQILQQQQQHHQQHQQQRQGQRQPHAHQQLSMHALASWMSMRFLGGRAEPSGREGGATRKGQDGQVKNSRF